MGGLVLLIDPDPSSREVLRRALTEDGHCVAIAATPAETAGMRFDVVVADIRTGLSAALALRGPATEVLIMACPERLDEAMAAIKQGAFDFVLRPFFVEDVSLTVECAAAKRRGRTLTNPLPFLLKNHELLG